ncbi:MAG: hypothetical protein IID37_14135 [Planctomycetes bacterium]|nr:hypothetical protein [Planctomycetota bacterium]
MSTIGIRIACIVGLAVSLGTAQQAQAGTIIPIEQTRNVSGFVIVPHCGGGADDDDEADGFDPFDGAAEAVLGCSLASGAALADQQSEIGASSLTAAGTSYSEASAGVEDTIHAIAGSFFAVTFELASPSRFLLEGVISADTSEDLTIGAFAEVRLTLAPDNEIIFEHTLNAGPGEPESEEFEEAGMLDAGVYTLRTQAATFIDNDVPPSLLAEASFDLAFNVATADCEGDANGDGVVDPLDSGFVLSRFGCPVGEGDPDCDTADQNDDGLVDPLDVGFILARFGKCE